MNRDTGEIINEELDHIKQSIKDILLTAKGTRVMRRTYGSNLYKLIDRPISGGLILQLSAACVMALQQWEPRITVTRFGVEFVEDSNSKLLCTIDFVIKNQPVTARKLIFEL